MPDKTVIRRDPVETLITEFIARELLDVDVDTVGLDDNLFVSGLVDSVGIVRLVAHLQEDLGVTVPPGDLVANNFRTVRVMADYLRRLRGP